MIDPNNTNKDHENSYFSDPLDTWNWRTERERKGLYTESAPVHKVGTHRDSEGKEYGLYVAGIDPYNKPEITIEQAMEVLCKELDSNWADGKYGGEYLGNTLACNIEEVLQGVIYDQFEGEYKEGNITLSAVSYHVARECVHAIRELISTVKTNKTV